MGEFILQKSKLPKNIASLRKIKINDVYILTIPNQRHKAFEYLKYTYTNSFVWYIALFPTYNDFVTFAWEQDIKLNLFEKILNILKKLFKKECKYKYKVRVIEVKEETKKEEIELVKCDCGKSTLSYPKSVSGNCSLICPYCSCIYSFTNGELILKQTFTER